MSARRKIITIDHDKCTGCGQCIPNCPEGALQIIDGKARLVSDLFCDGLGACIGYCPEGAMTVEEREAEPYDEDKVMANVVPQGPNVIRAHLAHLKDHGAMDYHRAAVAYLRRHHIDLPSEDKAPPLPCGCPGSAVRDLACADEPEPDTPAGGAKSRLRNWPVQIMLVPVSAPYLKGADLLIAADCAAAASPDFHDRFVKGRVLLLGCPKLDDAGFYREKLAEMFTTNDINSVTAVHMTVPCCFGLVQLVKKAIADSGKPIPFAEVTLGLDGKVVKE
jgi:ferredoxin